MKYSELISFSPIESTIQLKESNRTAAESARLVKTYVHQFLVHGGTWQQSIQNGTEPT